MNIHTYTHTHTYIYTNTHNHIYTHTYAYTPTRTDTHIRTHTQAPPLIINNNILYCSQGEIPFHSTVNMVCLSVSSRAHDSDVKQANKSKPSSGASLSPVQSRIFSSVPCLSSAPLLQPCVLGESQAWRPAGSHYHVQPCQSGLISGSASQATFPFLPILASGLGTQSHQGPISLQVASESHHGHCLSLPYSGAYLSSSHHTFVGGCFDR